MAGWEFGGRGVWRQRCRSSVLDVWKRRPKLLGERPMALESGWKGLASFYIWSIWAEIQSCCCFQIQEAGDRRPWGTIPALTWYMHHDCGDAVKPPGPGSCRLRCSDLCSPPLPYHGRARPVPDASSTRAGLWILLCPQELGQLREAFGRRRAPCLYPAGSPSFLLSPVQRLGPLLPLL